MGAQARRMDNSPLERFREQYASFQSTLVAASKRWGKGPGAGAGKTAPAAIVAASLAVTAQHVAGRGHGFRDASLALFRAFIFEDKSLTRRQAQALLDAAIHGDPEEVTQVDAPQEKAS